ncbi:MAG: site-2 protease family protein [Acidimicrobiia bacterium]|nr:site-2 protease family protein [Acidimicrobiia bacterium]
MIHENGFVDLALFLAILIPSVVLHEVAHGVVALRLGDTTARDQGRLTLNPVPHIDPFGSVIVPGILALSGATVWGWAKPVPVVPNKFRRPTEHMAVAALAGPLTNLLIAAVIARIGPFAQVGDRLTLTTGGLLPRLLFFAMVVNVALAVFNMLPIPPLDGSRLLPLVLSDKGRLVYARFSEYGFLVLIVIVLVFDGLLEPVGDLILWVVRFLV